MSRVVCIVEDNKAINRLFTTLLKKAGYEVHPFENGYTMLEWIKENKADIFILDYLLPDMTGVEVLKRVRNNDNNKSAKIVAVTGFATDDNIANISDSEFDGYLTKPVNTNTFVDAINKILDN